MDDFEGQYAHGFSIALDPVLCCVGLKEPSAVGFRIVSDTLLFYRMVQGHFRQLRYYLFRRHYRDRQRTRIPAFSLVGAACLRVLFSG